MIETISGWLQGVLLPGFGTLLLAAALGLVRRYVGKIEDERLRQLILELVQAAEQIYGPCNGEAKRRYVVEKLRETGRGKVDRNKLEAAVYSLSEF